MKMATCHGLAPFYYLASLQLNIHNFVPKRAPIKALFAPNDADM